jgi:uncharacterized DUF497 family protein
MMMEMRFSWDDAKHSKNQRERGIGFDYAARIFEGEPMTWIDDRFEYGEMRVRAIGAIGDDVLHVVYADRGDLRWIISARPASRKGRRIWQLER